MSANEIIVEPGEKKMSNKETEAVILSAVRTPSGSFQGGLSSLSAVDLGTWVVKAAVERAAIPNPEDINEVIMGNVVSAGLGQNPARQAVYSRWPPSIGGSIHNQQGVWLGTKGSHAGCTGHQGR